MGIESFLILILVTIWLCLRSRVMAYQFKNHVWIVAPFYLAISRFTSCARCWVVIVLRFFTSVWWWVENTIHHVPWISNLCCLIHLVVGWDSINRFTITGICRVEGSYHPPNFDSIGRRSWADHIRVSSIDGIKVLFHGNQIISFCFLFFFFIFSTNPNQIFWKKIKNIVHSFEVWKSIFCCCFEFLVSCLCHLFLVVSNSFV